VPQASSRSTTGIWRRPSLPEFDKAIAQRERMFARHHDRDWSEPRMGMDDAHGSGSILDHNIGKADRREAGRAVHLGLRFEPGPVSVGSFTEFGKGDGYALHEITGVFHVKDTPVFHPIVANPDRKMAVGGSQKPELSHRHHPHFPTIHLGFFEGERKQASRGWDEDTSTAARNILAMLAVACFLMAVSMLVDAIDAPQSIAFVAGETSR